jgi:hypothetical protein
VTYATTTLSEENYLNNVHEFEGRNLTAIRNEKYGTNIRNYTTKARLTLRSFHLPGRFVEQISGDYAELNKTLLEGRKFKQLDQGLSFLDEALKAVDRSDDVNVDFANIVDYVKDKSTFSGYYDFYPDELARTTLAGESSNSGAINMLLTLMLRHAGYHAEPLIVGTRDYRKPHPFNPDFSDFNHLVAYVTLEDETYIFDATSKLNGGLPESDVFNALGWIVSQDHGRNINLGEYGQAKVMVKSDWGIQPGGSSLAKVTIKSNYLGIHELSDATCYNANKFKDWLEASTESSIKDYEAKNDKSLTTITFNQELDEIGDKSVLYIEPNYYGFLDFDIFRRADRKTPLDIPYKINVTNIVKMNIPEGYAVESIPESKKLTLGEDHMKFSMLSTSTNDKVSINVRYKVDRNFYLDEQYADLRAFIGEIESTLHEKIVFKKLE